MYSYEFNVDCCNFGTQKCRCEFYEPFERFHSHKASILTEETENGTYTLFVSYASPVLLVIERNGFFQVYFNEETVRCSRSTIRQVSRFLREYFGGLLSYAELKHAMERMKRNKTFASYHTHMYASFIACKDETELLNHADVDMKYAHAYIDGFTDE